MRIPINRRAAVSPLALLCLAGISAPLHAQQAGQAPAGGSQLQQIAPLPQPRRAAPEIRVEQGDTPAAAATDTTRISVQTLRVTGQSIYLEAELIALTGFKPGSELTLTELRALAAKIGAHYRAKGYFTARAFLAAQDVKDGIVTITVSEGRFGKITLNNQSNVSNTIIEGLMDGIKSGDAITAGALEQRLLLLSDLPGLNVKSNLAPGASVGASDLVIDVTPGARINGSVDLDNEGNRYTGGNRIGGTVNVNEPFGQGDVATLRAFTSTQGINYARAAYQMQLGALNANRVKAGVAYTTLDYRLGREFAALLAKGSAEIGSVYASYPWLRLRNANLSTQLAFDAKKFQDKTDSTNTVTDKKVRLLMASVTGDVRDEFFGGGLNNFSLTWTAGNIDIVTPLAQANDAAALRTHGRYDKLGFTAARQQSLFANTVLYAAVNAQFAGKNLDSSEKLGLGGANAVRAYPSGEAFGDQGYVLNLELRYALPQWLESQPGQMQLTGFIDTGSVTLNKSPIANGNNRRTLSGIGLGLSWNDPGNFLLRIFYATKVGNAVATSVPDSPSRVWLQGVKFF